MRKILLIILIGLSSCQIFTLDFSNADMEYINWLEQGSKYIFVSSKKDTAFYEITSITDYRSNSNNPIESGGTFFSASNDRTIMYKKITKDTSYEFTFLTLAKNSNSPAQVEVLFEGCFGMFYDKNFNKNFCFSNKVISDLDSFEVNHHNNLNFPDERKGILKMWWSKSIGLLKYETRDSLIWTRTN